VTRPELDPGDDGDGNQQPGGETEDRRICVSGLYVARNEAGQAVDALAGQPLLIPRPHQPAVDVMYISWHHRQVFKGVA
jgi:putative restriction endonuclease